MTILPAARRVNGGLTLQTWRHSLGEAVPEVSRRIKWLVGEFMRASTIKFLYAGSRGPSFNSARLSDVFASIELLTYT